MLNSPIAISAHARLPAGSRRPSRRLEFGPSSPPLGGLGLLTVKTRRIDEYRSTGGPYPDRLPVTMLIAINAILAGDGHEYVPFAGQSVGLIDDILPVAEIVRRTASQAEGALARLRDCTRAA